MVESQPLLVDAWLSLYPAADTADAARSYTCGGDQPGDDPAFAHKGSRFDRVWLRSDALRAASACLLGCERLVAEGAQDVCPSDHRGVLVHFATSA